MALLPGADAADGPPTTVVEVLRSGPAGDVLVLTGPEAHVPGWITEARASSKVRHATDAPTERRLSVRNRWSAVVDLRPEPAAGPALWSLRAGGVHVRSGAWPGSAEVDRTTERIDEGDGWSLLRKTLEHHVKLTEKDVARILPGRSADVAVTTLATLPAGRLDTGITVVEHGEGPDDEIGSVLEHPDLHLRRYDGPVDLLFGGSLAVAGGAVLPESFRWYDARPLRHWRLVEMGDRFARIKRHVPPERTLSGSYFFFDYANSGHYGHLMTEALPRLWGWDVAKAADPGLKLLVRTHPRDASRTSPRPDAELLGAYGIDQDDVVWFDEPVRVESLVGATAMWHNAAPFHAHPDLVQVWDRIRVGLIGDARGPHERLFVTRHSGNRPCHNTAEVEQVFAERGFTVVEPGGMTRAEQALAFSGARVVAGFGGTGMFNLAFAPDVARVVLLNHTAYTARNEHLYAALRGADLDYFWSEPDVAGDTYEAHQSGWTFDLARHRDALDALE